MCMGKGLKVQVLSMSDFLKDFYAPLIIKMLLQVFRVQWSMWACLTIQIRFPMPPHILCVIFTVLEKWGLHQVESPWRSLHQNVFYVDSLQRPYTFAQVKEGACYTDFIFSYACRFSSSSMFR